MKSSSLSASCDQPLLILLGQRLAGHLLGRRDRQVSDLAANVLDRAPRLELDLATGLLHQLLAPGLGLGLRVALVDLARLAGAIDDLLRLPASLLEPLAVLGQDLVGLLADLLGVVDRLLDRVLTAVERRR